MSKRILAVMVGVIVAFSFATITIAEEKETAREEHIKKAQEDLATLGYYKGEASGKMDKDTREAVKEFQKKDMDMKMPSGISFLPRRILKGTLHSRCPGLLKRKTNMDRVLKMKLQISPNA